MDKTNKQTKNSASREQINKGKQIQKIKQNLQNTFNL